MQAAISKIAIAIPVRAYRYQVLIHCVLEYNTGTYTGICTRVPVWPYCTYSIICYLLSTSTRVLQ